jgi:dTDP-4-amino-4,6-dideoxygalactose transaminase
LKTIATTDDEVALRRAKDIPVLRPQLPKASALLPYLERIDESRVYSNWGQLVTELSARLSCLFGLPAETVVCANSGMSALVGAILAFSGRATPSRPLAIVPDYTFTATALSAQACGFEVVLASCHADTWTFSPDELLSRPDLLSRVGLIIPVAPYGRPIPQKPWLEFHRRTGIPIVIDGAACFESLLREPEQIVGTLPVVLSFHATKSFGTGEGGAVVVNDRNLITRTLQCLNFGFLHDRTTEMPSINGKMCEYVAAVGLAGLDGWHQRNKLSLDVFARYREAFENFKISAPLWGPPSISSSYVLLQCTGSAQAESVMRHLDSVGIGSRRWYGAGLSAHGAYRQVSRVDLHGRQALVAESLIGLPVAPDLTEQEILRIAAETALALSGRP